MTKKYSKLLFYFLLFVALALLTAKLFVPQQNSSNAALSVVRTSDNKMATVIRSNSPNGDSVVKNAVVEEKSTLVLAWTPLHSSVPFDNIYPPPFKNCPPNLNCRITSDRKRFNESDAVIFHMAANWRDPTPPRRPDQYFVFALWEPPTQGFVDLKAPKDFFNLTMTYRKDSDVVWPYGGFRRILQKSTVDAAKEIDRLRKIVEEKSKMAVQLVSVCSTPSRRELFVADLKKYIDVDVYGGCSDKKCVRDPNRNPTALGTKGEKPCDKMLTKDYKFYLSFENSLCKDYVTEKFYERMDNAFIVPIVLERKIIIDSASADKTMDEETLKVFNDSFIAADDFDNAKQLGDYLKYLDKNATAYLKYFEWRQNYEIMLEVDIKPGCELCRVVKEKKKRQINDINFWWIAQASCHGYKQKKL